MTKKQDLKVLLVDDEPKVTELLSYSLRNHAFIVKTAGSALEALEFLSKTPIDILVTDIRMPGMDGLELSRQVLEKYPDTQIIIISAHGDVDSAVEALKLGVVDFLQKPVDPKVLLLSLNSSAQKWRLRHDLRLAYQYLEKEKEFLTVTMRSIGDGVIASDLDGNVTMINRVAEDLTGWSAEEAMGMPLTDVFYIINEKTRKICENPVKKVLENGRIIGLANHTALIARDGTEKSIADSAAPIRDSDSRIIGVVLVFRDVTLEKRINVELAKNKKLESVGILAGGIAHDFNNILTGILGNINLAKIRMAHNQEVYDLLDAAENASQRAGKLTKQLLTFSKGGEPIREAAFIYDIVRESADFTLSGSSINCRIDRDSDLWAAEIDKGQISQVIQNIVLNARQAMPEGGTIHILCDNYLKSTEKTDEIPLELGDYVRVVISDEGIGIHQDQVEKIFDPYFSTKQEGSGLGLAVTYSIVKKHFGHIACKSIPGKGTNFAIYLPAIRQHIVAKRRDFTELKGQGRILVMDDEEMIRKITERMLENSGYDVVLAQDGLEALEIYKRAMDDAAPIDILILDLTIPGGMGGKETIKKLLEIDPQAAAIVSSGYSNDPVMANYKQYGFKGILDKPYLKEKLLKAISQITKETCIQCLHGPS
ncbi:MAG: response regulator [Desulfobacterales bacterium]|nr:response regulator [Desulfobacterales bacterium]